MKIKSTNPHVRFRVHRSLLVAAVWLVACSAGCETISQDVNALAESVTPVTPSQAARWMTDPHDADKRREGTTLIANSIIGGNEPYVKLYRDRVSSEQDIYTRAISIRALARHGTVEDALLIADQLDHPAEQVQLEAAKGLQRIHNPEVVDEMLTALKQNENPQVRAELVRGLGQYPQDQVFQALLAALDVRELVVNVNAAKSLSTLTGRDYGLAPSAWFEWYENAENPFADSQQYVFPTYKREETLLEKLVFWTENRFEHPAPPTGTRAKTSRSTYEDSTDDPSGQAVSDS